MEINRSTSLLLVAGESSGDLHGATLARELRKLCPGVRLVGAGGTKMRDAGVEIVADPTAQAAVGAVEAFHHMNHYLRLYRKLQSVLKNLRPVGAVLIDFPDFNLRFAERVVDHGVPVVYYISPQIWAWRPGRIKTIRRLVRKMLVIFKFEEELYRDAKVDVTYVGHPLLDVMKRPRQPETLRRELKVGERETLIGLLPGSRSRQFNSLFPRLTQTAEIIRGDLPNTKFVVACAPNIPLESARGPVPAVGDRTYEVMAASDLLISASGTATLEAAILGTPMIVTYVLHPLTALTLAPFLNLHNYAMVNIVAGRQIMPELYQYKAKPELLAREAIRILTETVLPEMRRSLVEVRTKLGLPGASRRAAMEIVSTLGLS